MIDRYDDPYAEEREAARDARDADVFTEPLVWNGYGYDEKPTRAEAEADERRRTDRDLA